MQNDADVVLPGPTAREFGLHLRSLRFLLGLDADQLARRSGLDRELLVSIEAGETEATTDGLFALADGLGMTCGTLLLLWEVGRIPRVGDA